MHQRKRYDFFIIMWKFLDSRKSTDSDRALKYFVSNMHSNPDTTKSDARFFLSDPILHVFVTYYELRFALVVDDDDDDNNNNNNELKKKNCITLIVGKISVFILVQG